MDWVWTIGVMSLGAVVGSFLNVCIYRLPRGESIVFPSSRCPRCGRGITWYDNIPLISYVLLKRRCRHCREAISGRYPLVEAITAVMALAAYGKFGFTFAFPVVFLFLATLIVVTFIDIEHQIIPHEIVLPGIPVFLLTSVFVMGLPFLDSFLGIMVGIGTLYLIAVYYEQLTGNEGMGGGDVNLMAMLGAFLGWQSLLFILMVAAVTGAVVGIVLMIRKDATMKYAVPFGPFLSLGAVLYLFWGRDLLKYFLYYLY
ncbi:MAG TPA: prepilin peptidase [Syntrophales bacterium]|jgi:leader peptidase (prepilin peptidase)/N-methyltransferase|nr:prepilin peptidase [Syntrophales bacterium]HON23508.1 prepilin peptidase [Syntrophales bacterium]HOU78516.1 prepilin peptidase [Syntrophales bacterium]HPC31599.1 prepilin peptidase [Syntrophales bacterium]HQG34339.1 prepilin peptidase [Syntrophales bacterium]